MIFGHADKIKVETYEEDEFMWICSVCGERIPQRNTDLIVKHLGTHEELQVVKNTKERFRCPCGCVFDTIERADFHIEVNKRLCGYYYRPPEDWRGEGILVVRHAEGSGGYNSYIKEYHFVAKIKGGSTYCGTSSEFVKSARSDSQISISIGDGFKKITEGKFRHIVPKMMQRYGEAIISTFSDAAEVKE